MPTFISPAPRYLLLISFLWILCFISACSVSPDSQKNVRITIIDTETGEKTPVRVRVTGASGGTPPVPEQAIGVFYGKRNRAQGFALQPDSSYYVDGYFEVDLPPGTYNLKLSKGYEYLNVEDQLTIEAGKTLSRTYRLDRWINSNRRGWYSADGHIHIQRSPLDNPSLLRWCAAEDINVGIMLWVGDFWRSYFPQYSYGEKGRYREGSYLLVSGQEEPRTPELGHTFSVGADEEVRFEKEYYHYDKFFDRLKELGGINGYVHQAMSFHGYRGFTLDVLTDRMDCLMIMEYCVAHGPIHLPHYYHYLNLGYKLTAIAGSDFPWCGKGPNFGLSGPVCAQIGDARFYTYAGPEFSYKNWYNGLRAGRTYVSSGPVLELTVNGTMPGDEVEVSRGSILTISAKAYGHSSQVPLRNLEIVGHGQVLKLVTAEEGENGPATMSIDFELPVEHGIWIAARCSADVAQVAHTTPVYVRVDGGGFHNPQTARHYLDLSGQYLTELENDLAHPEDRLDNHAWRYRDHLSSRIAEARSVIKRLRVELRK